MFGINFVCNLLLRNTCQREQVVSSSPSQTFLGIRSLRGVVANIIIIIMPLARISLILSRHFSLSFIASGRSSGLHPVSSHSCCMYIRAGRPAFVRPYVGVHRSTSLMSSSLLLQQCPAPEAPLFRGMPTGPRYFKRKYFWSCSYNIFC